MNKKQQQIIKDLEEVNKRLFRALTLLREENEPDKQFDYCTNPRLSDLSNCLQERATKIDKIVYQKTCSRSK